MNRIYQGKVTAVEIPDDTDPQGNPKWKRLDDWQSAIWNPRPVSGRRELLYAGPGCHGGRRQIRLAERESHTSMARGSSEIMVESKTQGDAL